MKRNMKNRYPDIAKVPILFQVLWMEQIELFKAIKLNHLVYVHVF